MTVLHVLDNPPEATGAGLAEAMLGEARAEVVWVNATAPAGFYDDPEVVRLVWLIGDLAAQLRGRLANHNTRPATPRLFDQEEDR